MGSGIRLDGAPVAFDSFRYYPGVRYYFLTHLHAGTIVEQVVYVLRSVDHTTGLSPSWNLGTIVCSDITKRLLIDKFSVKEEYIVRLYLLILASDKVNHSWCFR